MNQYTTQFSSKELLKLIGVGLLILGVGVKAPADTGYRFDKDNVVGHQIASLYAEAKCNSSDNPDQYFFKGVYRLTEKTKPINKSAAELKRKKFILDDKKELEAALKEFRLAKSEVENATTKDITVPGVNGSRTIVQHPLKTPLIEEGKKPLRAAFKHYFEAADTLEQLLKFNSEKMKAIEKAKSTKAKLRGVDAEMKALLIGGEIISNEIVLYKKVVDPDICFSADITKKFAEKIARGTISASNLENSNTQAVAPVSSATVTVIVKTTFWPTPSDWYTELLASNA